MLACTDAVNVIMLGNVAGLCWCCMFGRTNDCSVQADPQVRSAPS